MNRNLPILRLSFLKVRKAKIKTKELFVVHSLSRVQLFVIPWTTACKAPVSSTFSQSWLKFMFTESGMPSNHPILCHPLSLVPSIFLSIRIFSSESALRIRWPKHWSFSFSNSPSNEYSGLISFRMDFWKAPKVWGCFLGKPRYNQRVGTFSLTPQQERGAEV